LEGSETASEDRPQSFTIFILPLALEDRRSSSSSFFPKMTHSDPETSPISAQGLVLEQPHSPISSIYDFSSPKNNKQVATVRSQDPIIVMADACDDFFSSMDMILNTCSPRSGAKSPPLINDQVQSPMDACIASASLCEDVQSNASPTFQKRGRFLVWPASFGLEHNAAMTSRT
jgi:hypothetical protein